VSKQLRQGLLACEKSCQSKRPTISDITYAGYIDDNYCVLRSLNANSMLSIEYYDSPMVRGIIEAKWHTFARKHVIVQAAYFSLFLSLLLAYQVSGPYKHALW
jgi:hypothetical protein